MTLETSNKPAWRSSKSKSGDYLMLIGKTTYGNRIISSLGEYWQINEVTIIEDIPSLILHRCLLESALRGGPETLVIDQKNTMTISLKDDLNFKYEQVIYEEDSV